MVVFKEVSVSERKSERTRLGKVKRAGKGRYILQPEEKQCRAVQSSAEQCRLVGLVLLSDVYVCLVLVGWQAGWPPQPPND